MKRTYPNFKKRLVYLMLLGFTIYSNIAHSQDISTNEIDELVNTILSRSEKALNKADFKRAKEIISPSNFNSFKGYNKKHEIAQTVQVI